MNLLILLPLAAFGVGTAVIYQARRTAALPEASWQGAFLIGSTLWGLIVVLSTELLSLVDGINRLTLSLVWLVPLAGLGYLVWTRESMRPNWRDMATWWTALSAWHKAVIAVLGLGAGFLLLIAVKAPPNNVDSFIYHMTRVVHWAQNGTLDHYPATVNHQLLKPTWAETAILVLRVMWGGDRPANLVQWFSMAGSLVAATGIVRLLGGRSGSQLAAAAFVFSIPMGVMQATSTQNDYVAAFWAIVLAYFVVLSMRRPLTALEGLCLAGATGLGVLTKGTFFVYFPPLLAWFTLAQIWRREWRRAIGFAFAIGAAILIVNFGFWARNYATYGGPYGSADWLDRNLFFDLPDWGALGSRSPDLDVAPAGAAPAVVADGELDASLGTLGASDQSVAWASSSSWMWDGAPIDAHSTPPGAALSDPLSEDPGLSTVQSADTQSVRDLLMNLLTRQLQTMGRNLTAPVGVVHQAFLDLLSQFPSVFGEQYVLDMRGAAWNHEDFAGNPFHLGLVPISLVLLLIGRRRTELQHSGIYALVILATYAMVPIVIGHAVSKWGIRYQLPFFVLWGPAFGAAIATVGAPLFRKVAIWGLLLASVPWLLLNNTRPVIGMPPWPTATESIIMSSDSEILLATNSNLEDDFRLTAEAVEETGCKSIGLRLETGDLEYPLWWLLEAPQDGTVMQVINGGPAVVAEGWDWVEPCAVVCTICGDRSSFEGMPLLGRFDSFAVYSDIRID